MVKKYSQSRALLAVGKASLISIFRSPSAVVFSIGFPLIFILVFGFVGEGGFNVKVGIAENCDTTNPVYYALSSIKGVERITNESQSKMLGDLSKGNIAAILTIVPTKKDTGSRYDILLKSSSASTDQMQILQPILRDVINRVNEHIFPNNKTVATVRQTEIPGRQYKQIDFILPGMLGFSLLSAGIFGTAFVFFNLRQTLVLKRFFATPISRMNIILGETLARLIFQIITAIIIIGLGYFAFGFTLQHGWGTFFEMLILSAYGLIIFMGFGFIISSIAKSESTIPPLANIITLPQFLLAGTFFPIDVFPKWLQPFCNFLPLTYLNNAFRKVAFEGARLWEIPKELLILSIWGIVIYFVTVKVFRWE